MRGHIRVSSGVRARVGIFGRELVRKTRRAAAVIPGTFAMSQNAGPISNSLGELSSGLDDVAGPAGFTREGMTRRNRNRKFEAISLQRRVSCEPD